MERKIVTFLLSGINDYINGLIRYTFADSYDLNSKNNPWQ